MELKDISRLLKDVRLGAIKLPAVYIRNLADEEAKKLTPLLPFDNLAV